MKYKWVFRIIFASLALITVYFVFNWYKNTSKPDVVSRLVAKAAPASIEDFTRALAPKPFRFPDDHGPHPDFQTEWWYYTGNLTTSSGEHLGYQLTLFRRALQSPDQRADRLSEWATSQVYMAHFGLTDVQKNKHVGFERLARGAAGLSGASTNPFSIWLENWSVQEIEPGKYHLRANQDGYSLDLELVDLKGPVLQGIQGYSQKGPNPGNASYYYSLPRMTTTGKVEFEGTQYDAQGFSWMDHEYSTSALADDQIGWDWFSIQLDNEMELMVFQIRKSDGTIDPYSSGTLIFPDGSSKRLEKDDFFVEVLDQWDSPHSNARYPSKWRIEIPSEDLELLLTPHIQDQEMNLSYNYWEGATQVQGNLMGKNITGNGYVELTGYAGSMAGEF